jgi:hypothetical protein
MRKKMAALILGVFILGQSQSASLAEEKGVDELAIEGISKLMDALSLFVSTIPQYSAPEVLENGDIIIRRKKNTEDDNEDKDTNKPEETAA